MKLITLELKSDIADKFETYIKLFGSKELMFDKFFNYHINRLKREIARMQIKLEEYEQKYKITSSIFYERFENGELGDDKDYMLWAGIYEFQLDSKQKLAQLYD